MPSMKFDASTEIPDDALLIAYGNGDPEAARLLTERLAPGVLNFATRMLQDRAEAEDVTQEAMLRLWKVAPDWRQGEAKVTTWLLRITKNLCLDRLRKKPSVDLEAIDEPADETPSVTDRLINADRMKALEDALGQLPERQRIAVTLRHIEGLSNPDIADILETTVEAVESLSSRGKKALSSILAGQREHLLEK